MRKISEAAVQLASLLLASLLSAAALAADGPAPLAQLDARIAASPSVDCVQLGGEDFPRVAGATLSIFSAKIVPASGAVAEYCSVTGYLQPQIQFEIRLPTKTWNGRYFQTGCGGFCGVIGIDSCADALANNYVVAAHNMGHVGAPTKDPVWGSDPMLREDFAGRSTHVMALAGKMIAERYYAKRPARAYFRGCSTGGREGLMEAQRYPGDFDGIIAGDPAFPGRLGAIANNWDAHHLLRDDGTEVFTQDKLKLLSAAVMKACDNVDGVSDGIIMDPRACTFQPATLICPGKTDGPECLTAEQVRAAMWLYRGPVNSRGKKLMPGGVPVGSELAWNGTSRRSLAEGYLRYLAFPTNPPADYDYRKFDFDKDVEKTEEMARLYDPVAPFEAPDLRAFVQRGGKLIVYHGWADASVSPFGTLDYYAQVTARQGGLEKVQSWFRVFMVPGMFHCRGGDAPNNFDLLPEIVRWVEKGEAPDRVIATQKTGERVVRSRPLFPYPAFAFYSGNGDVNDAANWTSAQPQNPPDDRADWIREPK